MKIHKSFFDMYLKSATNEYKRFVTSIYPNAHFYNGFIYPNWSFRTRHDSWLQRPITATRWNISGIEAEYYAWMWASQQIGEDMLRKLES